MTYRVGEVVQLTTTMQGSGIAPTITLTVTKPDGTTTLPGVDPPVSTATGWSWSASVPVDQAGDWLYVFVASGTYVGVDTGQFHALTAALNIVGLAEVKRHANITDNTADRELLDFIGAAQQVIEGLVGTVVPVTVTDERQPMSGDSVWLYRGPVLSVTSVSTYVGDSLASSLTPGDWRVDATTGRLTVLPAFGNSRLHNRELVVTYRAGRSPIPEAIRWAAKELTLHLWRSTQANRGGRARSDTIDGATAAASFGVPNRVRDVLDPFLLIPAVA